MQTGLRPWRKSVVAARRFFNRNWRRWLAWRERLRVGEETTNLALAGLVGVLASLANLLFYTGTEWVKWLALAKGGDPGDIAAMLPAVARFATPALGGLAAGLVLQWGLRLVGQQDSGNLLEVVVAGDGRLPLRTNLIKAFSSLISVATGSSIGREGSITQLSATLASKFGVLNGWPPYRLRLMVACGAAGGIAAAYNAPIAGAVFAAQIVLGNFSMNLFAPLICSSVVAAVASRTFFGIQPWYEVPDFEFTNVGDLPWFLLLGILSGVMGATFLKLIRGSEILFERTGLPIVVRLTLAGTVVGGIALIVPEVWGNGYAVTSRILDVDSANAYGLAVVAGLLLAKLGATVITVGAGTVGGVFTPTLFLGAAAGSIFGQVLHSLQFATPLSTGVFALVGMAGILAATTHSPLLAMIMVFEISLDSYSLMPAFMLTCAVGTLVGRRLHASSIYTGPLRQRGILGQEESDHVGIGIQQTVGDLMLEPVPPLRETATVREMANRFLKSSNNFLPVVDARRRLLGLIALQDLKEHLSSGQEIRGVIAYDVMRPRPQCLTPGQKLQEALPILLLSEMRSVPVVNNLRDYRLVGALRRSEALGLLSEAIAAGSKVSR